MERPETGSFPVGSGGSPPSDTTLTRVIGVQHPRKRSGRMTVGCGV